MLRRFMMSEAYLWTLIGSLFVINMVQVAQKKRLITERDDVVEALHEIIGQRDELVRVLSEHNVELSEFDLVILDSKTAKLESILEKYQKENPDA